MFRSTLIFLIVSAAFAADVRIVEEIAVKVNGDIITRGDLADKRRLLTQQIQQQEHLTGPALEQAVEAQTKDMLATMISERLLVQKAKELDLKVDGEVNRYISELQVKSGLSDLDKFHDWIHEQTGMTFEDFKQQTTDTYLTQRLIGAEIQSHVNVPVPDMQKYYDEHKTEFVRKDEVFLSKIEISTAGKTPDQIAVAEKKAQDLVARARKGEKFSDLARTNSDDPETARDGGQLPPSGRGILRPEIEAKAFTASKGTVLDPFTIPGAILILRVDDRFEAGQESFDEAKEEIQQKLAGPLMKPKVDEYLRKLRQQAFLEIKDGYVDTSAAPGKDTRWHEVVGLKPETTTKEEVAAHRKRPKFLGVIPHGSVAPGTRETSGQSAPVETATIAPATEGAAPATAPDAGVSAPSGKAIKVKVEKPAKPAKPPQPIKQ